MSGAEAPFRVQRYAELPRRTWGKILVELGTERIFARTILWAAGVRASPLTKDLGVPIDRAGRVWVEEDLSVPDRWLTVHALFLVGYRSRIAVVFEWGWAYFTSQRRSRVILQVPRALSTPTNLGGGLRRRATVTVVPSPLEPAAAREAPLSAAAS